MDKIASEIYRQIEDGNNPARHKAPDGLIVTLKYTDAGAQRLWTLSLTRWGRQADDQHRLAAKEAFQVPKDHEWTPTYKDGWGIIRYTWLETNAEQLALQGVGLPETEEDPELNNWQEKFD